MNRSDRARREAERAERIAPPNEMRGERIMGRESLSYDETTRSVEAVLSTGAAVARWGFIEELEISDDAIDLNRVERGVCNLLDTHNAWELNAVLGTIDNVRIEDGELIATLHFGETDAARQAEGMVKRGEIKGISIGYRVSRWEITVEAESSNDKDTWRATKWELLEASLVPVPADAGAGVRSAPGNSPGNGTQAATQGNDDMNRQQSGGAAAPAIETPPAVAAEPQRAAPAAQTPPAPTPPAQRTHAQLSATDALALLDLARSFGDGVASRARELIADNDADKIAPDAIRAALLKAAGEAQEARTGGVRAGGSVVITADENDKFARGAANAIMQRAGVLPMVQAADKAAGGSSDFSPGEFRGMRLVDIAALSNERLGIRAASRAPEDIVRAALHGASVREVSAQGLQGTADFSTLLGNVVHQTIRAAYATVPDTWRKFAATGSVTDFRPHYRVRMSTFGTLRVVNENGEFENQPIPDGSKESIAAQTKGMIVALTRQAIINDDLGAFSTLAVQLGRTAARTIEEDVYAVLALNSGLGPTLSDGNTLFHASHGNIATTGAAISVDAFDTIDALMAAQKDKGGKEYLDLSPDVLLVPRGMRGDAIVINGAEYDPNKAGKDMVPNKVRGMFSDIVASPRLSGNRWYVFADPAIAPVLEVAFLNGEQEPFIDRQDGFRVDGVEWKVRHDYGVGAVDYVGAATNAGA